MLPIIRLSQAWLDARGWSLAEGTLLLELDQTAAVQAGAGDVCPRCTRSHTEYQLDAFVSDSATVNSEHERGRRYVLCICGATYWYAAVDDLNAPTDEARVRAASASEPVAPPPQVPPGQQMLVVPLWYEEQRRQATFAALVARGLIHPRRSVGARDEVAVNGIDAATAAPE